MAVRDDMAEPLLTHGLRSTTPPCSVASGAGSVASVSTNGPSRLQHSGSSASLSNHGSFGAGSPLAHSQQGGHGRHDSGHLGGFSGGVRGSGFSDAGVGGIGSGPRTSSSGATHRVEPSAMSVRKSVAEVRREGWVYRESTYLDSVVNQRYGAIYPHALVTFRDPHADVPTKVWPLHGHCTLSPLEHKDFTTRGRHSNIVVAFATRHVHKKQLWYFCLRWPEGHVFSGEPLKLCFEEEDEAHAWRDALVAAVSVLSATGGMALSKAAAHRHHGGGLGRLRRHFTPDRSKQAHTARRLASASHRSMGSLVEPSSGSARVHEDRIAALGNGIFGGRSTSTPSPVADSGDSGLAHTADDEHDSKWGTVRHLCGVAVYQEEEGADGHGGATMVSTCVRAAPSAVFKTLMDIDSLNEFMFPFFSTTLLEQRSPHTRVAFARLQSRGWLAALCAPREAVLEQHWRQDEDGTYIVLAHSVRHHRAREPPRRWWSWFHPVRTQITACGYTISPLQPRYANGAQECLVTMVLKANLGGWLGDTPSSHPRGFAWLTAPLLGALHRAFQEPLLLSVVNLRDAAEQERFVVKPFSMRGSIAADKAVASRASSLAAPQAGHLVAPAVRYPSLSQTSGGPQRMSVGGSGGAGGGDGASEGTTDTGGQPTLSQTMWSYPGPDSFKLRGRNYLRDKKKVPAEEPVYALAACDLTESDDLVWDIARYLPSIKDSEAAFTFVVNFMVPGPPFRNLVMSWSTESPPPGWGPAASTVSGGSSDTPPPQSPQQHSRASSLCDGPADEGGTQCSGGGGYSIAPSSRAGDRDDSDSDESSPFDVSLARFLEGEGPAADKRRNNRFKLIPSILKSSWVVKQAVGTTPVLLGNKLVTKYFRGERYFEVDVDISSSYAASGVVNIVKGATKSMVIDFGVLIEGQAEDELPERLLGSCRFSHLDMDSGMYLDHEGHLHANNSNTRVKKVQSWKRKQKEKSS